MSDVRGARDFQVSGESYDLFMGRYSRELAPLFADFCGIQPGHRVLDVGCGPGAFAGVLVERLGTGAVAGVDPSPPFVFACRERHPGVEVRVGRAEELPFEDDAFDRAAAQLVLHFTTDPVRSLAEMARVVVPGGIVGACVWDRTGGMELLTAGRVAEAAVGPVSDDTDPRFGTEGELRGLFERAGLDDVTESTLTVTSAYAGFAELMQGLTEGVGPAGAKYRQLSEDDRDRFREALFDAVGRPAGGFELSAVARAARGRVRH